jgi:hypothetical protein
MTRILLILLMFSMGAVEAQDDKLLCDTEKHAEFNFWLGEWRVTTPDGKHAGDSQIEKIQDGCVVKESWSSGDSDYTGTSYNYFSKETDQWQQLWLDNKGGRLHLKGKRRGSQMILRSDEKQNADGAAMFNRITWTGNDDGSVRQYWEVITEGKLVSVAFDGVYRSKQ